MIIPLLLSLRPRWLVVACAVASMGCANAHAPVSTERVHGLIQLPEMSSLPIHGPVTAKVGVPFEVVVRTFGSSTCDLPAQANRQPQSGRLRSRTPPLEEFRPEIRAALTG